MAGLGLLVLGALQLWVSHPLQASTDPMIHVRQLRPGWALEPSLVTEGLSELAGSEGQNPDRERHTQHAQLCGPCLAPLCPLSGGACPPVWQWPSLSCAGLVHAGSVDCFLGFLKSFLQKFALSS